MSFWSALGKIGAGIAAPFTGGASLSAIPLIDAAGAGINGATAAAAKNRGAALQAQMDGDMMRMRADELNRSAMGDAWKRIAQAGYVKGGGSNFKPSTPYSYSFAPKAPSQGQQDAAALMEQEMLKRMRNPIGLSDYSTNMKAGFWEKLGNIAGPTLTAFGAAQSR